jgi:hypothetical protein
MDEERPVVSENDKSRREVRAALESYFVESGFYTAEMTPRGRLVVEVFDCQDGDFPAAYLEASGHLHPTVAVRLHDVCASLSA